MMLLLGSMIRSRSQCEQSDFFFFFFWELAISFLCFWPTNFCLTHPNKLQQKSKRKRKSHKHTSGPSSWRIDESHLCIYLSFLRTEKFIAENLIIEWYCLISLLKREPMFKTPSLLVQKKKEKKREIYHLLI